MAVENRLYREVAETNSQLRACNSKLFPHASDDRFQHVGESDSASSALFVEAEKMYRVVLRLIYALSAEDAARRFQKDACKKLSLFACEFFGRHSLFSLLSLSDFQTDFAARAAFMFTTSFTQYFIYLLRGNACYPL